MPVYRRSQCIRCVRYCVLDPMRPGRCNELYIPASVFLCDVTSRMCKSAERERERESSSSSGSRRCRVVHRRRKHLQRPFLLWHSPTGKVLARTTVGVSSVIVGHEVGRQTGRQAAVTRSWLHARNSLFAWIKAFRSYHGTQNTTTTTILETKKLFKK